MRAIRRYNPMAYRQPRWHLVEGEGTTALCGTDVAAVKGNRRGATRSGRIVEKDPGELEAYGLCGRCRAKRDGAGSIKLSTADMKALVARATEAAEVAFRAATPTPMMVYTPKNMMASLVGGDDGGPDPNEPVYHVADGACGFAWVTIRPGTSRFARFLRREGIGKSDDYRGGTYVWAPGSGMSQSYARKMAAARAYAEVLRAAGINAFADGRLD